MHAAPYTFASDACDSYEVATTRAPFSARASASEKEKSPSPTVRIDCPCLYRPIDATRGILVEFAARTSRKHVSGLAFGSAVEAPWLISTLAQHGTQPDSAHWTVSTMTCKGPSSSRRWSAVALGAGMDGGLWTPDSLAPYVCASFGHQEFGRVRLRGRSFYVSGSLPNYRLLDLPEEQALTTLRTPRG